MVSMMNFEAPNSIVDEAGQCTEAHTLCMINRLTKFLILVGDHQQLPPVVRELPGHQQGTGLSALERLFLLSLPKTMLATQYRMFPSIAYFPNELFYRGEIIDGVEEGIPPAGIAWAPGQACLFLNVNGEDEKEEDGTSYFNSEEKNVLWRLCMPC